MILGHFRDRNDDDNDDHRRRGSRSTHPSNSIVGKQGFYNQPYLRLPLSEFIKQIF